MQELLGATCQRARRLPQRGLRALQSFASLCSRRGGTSARRSGTQWLHCSCGFWQSYGKSLGIALAKLVHSKILGHFDAPIFGTASKRGKTGVPPWVFSRNATPPCGDCPRRFAWNVPGGGCRCLHGKGAIQLEGFSMTGGLPPNVTGLSRQWGNGMIANGYYRSFPHSLVSQINRID